MFVVVNHLRVPMEKFSNADLRMDFSNSFYLYESFPKKKLYFQYLG